METLTRTGHVCTNPHSKHHPAPQTAPFKLPAVSWLSGRRPSLILRSGRLQLDREAPDRPGTGQHCVHQVLGQAGRGAHRAPQRLLQHHPEHRQVQVTAASGGGGEQASCSALKCREDATVIDIWLNTIQWSLSMIISKRISNPMQKTFREICWQPHHWLPTELGLEPLPGSLKLPISLICLMVQLF